jgi:hypothetical protein
MQIEIQKPEVAQRARSYIESGRFHDTDELLMKAFDALVRRRRSRSTSRHYGRRISSSCATRCAALLRTWISAGTRRKPVRSIYERFSFRYQHPIGNR